MIIVLALLAPAAGAAEPKRVLLIHSSAFIPPATARQALAPSSGW
jgi:hypothetical protein